MSRIDPDEIQRLFDAELPVWRAQEVARKKAVQEATRLAEEQRLRQAERRKRLATRLAPRRLALPLPSPVAGAAPDVVLATGTTRIQAGSLRAKVLAHLQASGGKASIADLRRALGGVDPKPVVAKLVAAGWMKHLNKEDK